jgi:hypothetical protein
MEILGAKMNKSHLFHSIVFRRAATAACDALIYFGPPVKPAQERPASGSPLSIAYSFFSRSQLQRRAVAYLTTSPDGQPVLATHRSASSAQPTSDSILVGVHLGKEKPAMQRVVFDRDVYAANNKRETGAKRQAAASQQSGKRPRTLSGKPPSSAPGSSVA